MLFADELYLDFVVDCFCGCLLTRRYRTGTSTRIAGTASHLHAKMTQEMMQFRCLVEMTEEDFEEEEMKRRMVFEDNDVWHALCVTLVAHGHSL